RDNRVPLAASVRWGVNDPLKPEELRGVLQRLAEMRHIEGAPPQIPDGPAVSGAQVAAALQALHPQWGSPCDAATGGNAEHDTARDCALAAAGILRGDE